MTHAKVQAEPYIYADNAATTKLSERALSAMMPYLTDSFGNPGGIHRLAKQAARDLDHHRQRIATCLGCGPRELLFTSCGTESDNWALRGFCKRYQAMHPQAPIRVITSVIEHHAVLHTCQELETDGAHITYLPVDAEGFVDPKTLQQALEANRQADRAAGLDTPGTALASIMLANNEVGSIEDIPTLAETAHAFGVPFHTDAVQAVGHVPVDVEELGIDALSLSSHKFHGPRGCGALYLRAGIDIPPLLQGGGQEFGKRSGTQNLAGIAGTAEALEEALENLPDRAQKLTDLRVELTRRILADSVDVIPTGPASATKRLPSIASFICKNTDAELLVGVLDRMGVAAATGSACSAGTTDPSHVIQALGYTDPAWNRGTLRLSFADDATESDIALLAQRVVHAIERTRMLG